MERVAVLLLLGSLAVLAAADPAEYQSKGKYGYEYKGPHGKEYPPHGYPPEGPKYKYDHAPHGYEYKPDGYYKPEVPYSYDPSHYDNKVYDHNPLNGEYGEPSPYDGGYWGGLNGRQLIHLQAVYPEDFLNTTLFPTRQQAPAVRAACKEVARSTDPPPNCDQDFGVLCAWRHHENDPYSYSKGNDYASAKWEPIFKTAPVQPLEIGKGWVGFDYQDAAVADGIQLVTFNGHQRGYKIADITGFINFKAGADACHPIIGPNTKITFNDVPVPVYLIFGKVKLPNDPTIVLPLGGFKYISNNRQGAAKIQSADKADKGSDYKADYKTTPEGNKYAVKGDTMYVWNEKEAIYCGLSLVARGDVKVHYQGNAGDTDDIYYEGTLEWPIVWTDLITTLPLLIDDQVDPVTRSAQRDPNLGGLFTNLYFFLFGGPYVLPTFDTADIITFYVEKTLDRIAAVCKSNPDMAWITPGAINLDVVPVPRP